MKMIIGVLRHISFYAAIGGLLSACGGGGVGGDSQDPDPTVVDRPVAYVERPVPTDNNDNPISLDAREIDDFNPGARLLVKPRASVSATPVDVTSRIIGDTGDVKDVEINRDGTKVVFAMRAEDDNMDPDETWEIWEYDIASDTLASVLPNAIKHEGHDFAPHYMPNEDVIVFSSTRQAKSLAVLTDEAVTNGVSRDGLPYLEEGRDEPAAQLHTYHQDTNTITQITFNASHDLDPTVLENGRILFTRWENWANRNQMSLYTVRPDGSGLEAYYGIHSHNTGTNNSTIQFLDPREMMDGRIMVVARPFDNTFEGGDIHMINTTDYVDNTTPVTSMAGLSGPAQTSPTGDDVTTETGFSLGGRFSSAYPFWDGTNRALVSFSACIVELAGEFFSCANDAALNDPAATVAPPRYGLFVYDFAEDAFLPVVTPQAGVYYTDAVVAQPRTSPNTIITETTADDIGTLHIQTVYGFDGEFFSDAYVSGQYFNSIAVLDGGASPVTSLADLRDPAVTPVANRPARFLRLIKPAPISDDMLDADMIGADRSQNMREILGYAEIEPDGSVKVDVPANVPLSFTIVDANGRRIGPRHQKWFQVRPGETLTCAGCHIHNNTTGSVHGRDDVVTSFDDFASIPTALQVNRGANAVTGFGAGNTGVPFSTGQTMAEARYADASTPPTPSMDIDFTDVWTDSTTYTAGADITYLYNPGAYSPPRLGETPVAGQPVTDGCIASWSPFCRTIINYLEHIQPIWEVDRGADTCTSCHNDEDDMGNPQEPAGNFQLDFTSTAATDYVKSYEDLLVGDVRVRLEGGMLVVDLVDTGTVDADGNPILAPDPIGRVLTPGSANASDSFFDVFAAGASHDGRLNENELKLISEWIDLGAQYYNDPAKVP